MLLPITTLPPPVRLRPAALTMKSVKFPPLLIVTEPTFFRVPAALKAVLLPIEMTPRDAPPPDPLVTEKVPPVIARLPVARDWMLLTVVLAEAVAV